MQAWVFFVILGVFAVGMLWGFVVGRSKNTSLQRAEQLEIELHDLRSQTSEYKQQVSQHFAKTADVVNAMTSNYRALYDQLIKGAQDLCGDQLASAKLDPTQVRYIEHRRNNMNENKEGSAPSAVVKGPSNGPAPTTGGSAGTHSAGNGERAPSTSTRAPGGASSTQAGSVIEQAVQRAGAKANGEADERPHAPEIEIIAQADEEAPSPVVDDDGEDKTQVQAKSPQGGSEKPGVSESLTVH
jgi:uncharacterized protein